MKDNATKYVLICLCLLVAVMAYAQVPGEGPKNGPRPPLDSTVPGRYALSVSGNGVAYRIDTATGTVWRWTEYTNKAGHFTWAWVGMREIERDEVK